MSYQTCTLRLIGVISHASAKQLANALAPYEVFEKDYNTARRRSALELYRNFCSGIDQLHILSIPDGRIPDAISKAMRGLSCSASWKSKVSPPHHEQLQVRHAPSGFFFPVNYIDGVAMMPVDHALRPEDVAHYKWLIDFATNPDRRFAVADSNHELMAAAEAGVDDEHIALARKTLGEIV